MPDERSYRVPFICATILAVALLASTGFLLLRPSGPSSVSTSTVTHTGEQLSPEVSSVVVAESVDVYSGVGPIQAGIDHGIFRALGLNVSWVATLTGQQALQSGSVQFGIYGPPFAPDAAGGTLEAVGQLLPNFPAAIIAAPGITSIDQLKGKTFGCTASGSLTCIMAYLFMKSQNWTSDQNLIKPVGAQSALVTALEGGDIQAFIFNWGTALQLQHQGKATILGDIRTFVPSWYSGCILVSKEFAADHPNTVKLFLQGVYQADAWIAQNPAPTISWIRSHYGLDAGVAGVLYNTTQFALLGTIQPGVLKFMYDATAQAYGLAPVELNDTFTNEYLPSLTYTSS